MPVVLYVVNEAYFFLSHRLPTAKAARAAGYEVHVACPSDHVWAPEGFTLEALSDAGFIYHEIPLSRRGLNPLRDIQTLAALFVLYKRLKPTIVHHLTIKPIVYGGIAATLARLPAVICTVTGLGQAFVGRGVRATALRYLVTFLYRLALHHRNTHVIVQNREDGQTLARLGLVGSDDVTLVRGSGVSLSDYRPSVEPEGVPVVILPARMIREKGVDEFVESASRLSASGCRARFVLVGDTQPSNPRSVPERELQALVKSGIVEWWGRRTDMANVYRACHIVCLPSKYGEGVPKVLLEAAASGRPVVCSDIAGCREVVVHEATGLLCRAGDVSALTSALVRLIDDADLRRRYGAAARAVAEREFSDTKIASTTLDVYARALTLADRSS
jgi:glycosyltransferase involved in cell wall biosynthesis